MSYLKTVVEDLIGSYTPIVQQLSDGSEVVQYDISWIVSAVILVICLWSIFRIIGGLICNR